MYHLAVCHDTHAAASVGTRLIDKTQQHETMRVEQMVLIARYPIREVLIGSKCVFNFLYFTRWRDNPFAI